jgi:beta-phosphoglucomutase
MLKAPSTLPSGLKAIVFDFDGIVADSEPLHCEAFRRMVEPWGVTFTFEEYAVRYMGYDDRDFFRVTLQELGRGGEANDSDRIEALSMAKQRVFEKVVEEGVEAVPGVLPLIGEVQAVMPLAVASGATRRDIELIVDRLGLHGCFDPIVTADDVAKSKPHPETYALAADGLAQRHPDRGIRLDTCLAIEDTPIGIRSARAAGLLTLGVATTSPLASLNEAHRAVPSFAEVSLEKLRDWFG